MGKRSAQLSRVIADFVRKENDACTTRLTIVKLGETGRVFREYNSFLPGTKIVLLETMIEHNGAGKPYPPSYTHRGFSLPEGVCTTEAGGYLDMRGELLDPAFKEQLTQLGYTNGGRTYAARTDSTAEAMRIHDATIDLLVGNGKTGQNK